jgi:CAAX protease family protein
MRSRVFVDRETCETCGGMAVNLAAGEVERPPTTFPYSNWGPGAAVIGVFLALAIGGVLGLPAVIADHPVKGEDLSTAANVIVQLAAAIGFVLVPISIAAWRGASFKEALRRLGVRSFRPSAFKWMAAAIGAYLFFAFVYSTLIGQPHQKDIAEGFGAIPIQVLLIVFAAPVSEEVCFRGMLFGGLRERLPRIGAAAISALIFGGLHAITGVSAVPPLIAFGFVLALLYEKTGSIVPGILLHMLNNSVALLGQ